MPEKHRQKTVHYPDSEIETATDSMPHQRKKVRWEQNVPVNTSTDEENNSDEEELAKEKERICWPLLDSYTEFIIDLFSRMVQTVSEPTNFSASLA